MTILIAVLYILYFFKSLEFQEKLENLEIDLLAVSLDSDKANTTGPVGLPRSDSYYGGIF